MSSIDSIDNTVLTLTTNYSNKIHPPKNLSHLSIFLSCF